MPDSYKMVVPVIQIELSCSLQAQLEEGKKNYIYICITSHDKTIQKDLGMIYTEIYMKTMKLFMGL